MGRVELRAMEEGYEAWRWEMEIMEEEERRIMELYEEWKLSQFLEGE